MVVDKIAPGRVDVNLSARMSGLSPSLYAANPMRMIEEITAVSPWAESFHIDMMDGVFAPEFGLNLRFLRALASTTPLPLDVHLMLEHPWRMALDVAELGVRSVALHLESPEINAQEQFCALARLIQSHGAKVHAALRPETPIAALEPVLDSIDGCLLLSAPAGGGAFDPRSFQRLLQRPPALYTMIDGKIEAAHFQLLKTLGIDVIVIGAALFADAKSADNARRFSALLTGSSKSGRSTPLVGDSRARFD